MATLKQVNVATSCKASPTSQALKYYCSVSALVECVPDCHTMPSKAAGLTWDVMPACYIFTLDTKSGNPRTEPIAGQLVNLKGNCRSVRLGWLALLPAKSAGTDLKH